MLAFLFYVQKLSLSLKAWEQLNISTTWEQEGKKPKKATSETSKRTNIKTNFKRAQSSYRLMKCWK